MQDNPHLDKPFPMKSCFLSRIFKVVRFSDKLKALVWALSKFLASLRKSRLKFWHKIEKRSTQKKKHWNPYHPKELLLFPHIQSDNVENPVTFLGSDTSDKIQKGFFTSFDNCKLNDVVFDDDLLCNGYGDTS